MAVCACGQRSEERRLTAAFLYNIAKFVEWPAGAFARPTDPVAACVVGDDSLRHWLSEAGRSGPIGGRNFVARRILNAREAKECHLLFVSASERNRWGALARAIQGASVLTVGEFEGFLSQGGVANLKREGESIRLQVSLPAAARARVRISSRLLSLAEVVEK